MRRNSRHGEDFDRINDLDQQIDQDGRPNASEQLVEQIKETADKLLRDKTNRGDVKLLNTAFKELRYAFKMFQPYRNRRKVSIFGSARLPLDHPACVQAIDFGRQAAQAGWMVVTGAAQGIMEAGHVGAGREASIGVNILLPFEQEPNSIIAGDPKLVHLKYFFTRKLLFVKESDAIVLLPGGFGTLDEGFEVLTLIQTGKSHMFPVVMLNEPGGDYWEHWQNFAEKVLVGQGLISPEDMALFKTTDSVEEALEEVLNFYRVYHSMRYVKSELVLRLRWGLSDKLLDQINSEFADILAAGKFEQTAALPAEVDDMHLADMPRLRFHFDRRSLGRLRMLIDLVNREG